MSQENRTAEFLGLEEFFLSPEFGQKPSGGTPPAGPLAPLVATEAPGHASTTHRRRTVAVAALSAAAAALLIASGLIGGTDRPAQVVHSASPSTPPVGAPPLGSGPMQHTGATASRGTPVSLADLTTSAPAGVTPPRPGDAPGATDLPASRVAPAGTGPGTGSTSPSPSPAPPGDPLAPVTSSVGSVVPGAFTTVSGLVMTVTTGLPAAAPLPLTAGPVDGS
jgi:hypothetical protein